MLEREQLSLYLGKSSSPIILSFPKEVVAAQEIKDQAKFSQLLQDFLASNCADKKEIIIVLSQDLVFQNSQNEDPQKFLEEIPFPPEALVSKNIMVSGNMIFTAANKSYYLAVYEVIKNCGGTVSAVVPISVWGASGMDAQLAKTILADKKTVQENNLLPNYEPGQIRPKLIILAIAGLLGLASLLGIVYILRPQKPVKTSISELPIILETPTTPATVSAQFKNKTDLKILVFNGTGGEGEAAKVAKILQDLGFVDIKVDNLPIQNKVITELVLDSAVASETAKELVTALSQPFPKLTSSFATAGASFNVVIITGQ